MNRFRLMLGLLLACAAPVRAQMHPPSPPLVKYGKWAVLGASLTMNILAARAHDDADRAFKDLEAYCLANEDRCLTGGGAYVDPLSEGLYQRSVGKDRVARRWLVAGETALLGAGVMFIWELSRPKSSPGNIPFEPKVSTVDGVTRLGVSLSF